MARGDQSSFTYEFDGNLPMGSLVRVSVGKKLANGIVLQEVSKPTFNTKPIDIILEAKPLPEELLKAASWLGEYYSTHLAIVLQTLLPSGLHKNRRNSLKEVNHPKRIRTNIVLNSSQEQAIATVLGQPEHTFLLRGVTGSGKTQVYIEIAKHMHSLGKSTIILVPEISLTSQLVAEFSNHFTNLIVTHSGMTEAERHLKWRKCLETTEPLVVVGPRSALFSPLHNLGLIIIDECHEQTFKQEQSPRYSALRLASVLAKEHNAKLILGSATPSITDYYLATTLKIPIIRMDKSATVDAQEAEIVIVDQKNRSNFTKHRFLSTPLIKNLEESIEQGKQSLLFHNRRGTSPNCLCERCGWLAGCPNCFVPLTLHADKHQLLCHLCGYNQRIPNACPQCSYPDIIFKGIGTKLIEQEVKKLFPKANIARFDADNNVSEALHTNYQALYDGDVDIIIGTQLLAKGLDLPKLRTVGVIQADSGLMMPDYLAEERVFQLIHQVTGRVGRHSHASHIIVQTYQPDHPAIQLALTRDYDSFYERQIAERNRAQFPPFTFLLKLTCVYQTEEGAVRAGKELAPKIRKKFPSVQVLGPTPSFYERLGGTYRWQIIVKSKHRHTLLEIAKKVPAARWQIDIDPASLL